MNKIYYNSPIFMQNIFTSIYGFKLRKERYNKEYKKALNHYIHDDYNDTFLLNDLVRYLKNNIKFYDDIEIDEENLVSTVKNLPFTEKEDLRENLNDRSKLTKDNIIVKTGGTTGKSLKVYSSERDRALRMAYLDYIKYIHGVRPFSKRASFTGKEITPNNHKNVLWRYNKPMNQILYASFKLNADNAQYVYKNLVKNKPKTIDGFPTSIHLIAKYILLNNIKINWEVKAIFPTAETLSDNMRFDIEKAFNTKVIDQYASSEGAPFIYIDKNKEYKIGTETGFFEFFKINNNIYEMVVTSYINFATPIVRYRIGDNVQINSKKKYLNSIQDDFKIEKILGRNSDYLLGNDNNVVTSVNLANVIKDLGDSIIQSQFIQQSNYKFSINLVVSEKFNRKNDEKVLINKLNHRLGNNNKYKFNYLSEIPKENSGKTRFIINEMSD